MSLRTIALSLLVVGAGAVEITAAEPWKQSGRLRVLAATNEPFFSDDAQRPGFDREILEGFAKLHRLTLEPVFVESWDMLVPELIGGRGDLIAGTFSITPERSRLIAFTVEVFTTYDVVMTRKPQPVVLTRRELRRQVFGVIRGTSLEQTLLAEGISSSQLRYMRPEEIRPALRSGIITAVVYGLEDALPDQRKDPDLQIGMTIGGLENFAYGVRKEDVELRSALDQYVTAFRRTPSWNRLVVKYLGDAALDVLQRIRRARAKDPW